MNTKEPTRMPVINPLNGEIIGREWSSVAAAKVVRERP